MKKTSVLLLVLSLLVSGCATNIHSTEKDGVKATTVTSTPPLGPANTLTIVERPGKEDIVYASDDRSMIGIIAPAVIGTVGAGIIANNAKCSSDCGGSLVIASSTAVAETSTDVDLKVK